MSEGTAPHPPEPRDTLADALGSGTLAESVVASDQCAGVFPSRTRALPTWWPVALLGAFVVIFFWDSFLAGKVLCMRDAFGEFLPARVFAGQAFRQGVWPLWNHYSGCGQPFLADPQMGVLYPLNLPFYVFRPALALTLTLALHLVIMSVSTYALARHWQLGRAAALLSAVAFTFCTHAIAVMEFVSYAFSLSWSPLTVLLASMVGAKAATVCTGPAARCRMLTLAPPVCALAVVMAMHFLSGYPQPFQFTLMIALPFCGVRALLEGGWRGAVVAGIGLAVAGALALGLVMPQFLMTLELIPHSTRGTVIDPGLDMASLHPRHLLTWLLPFLFGRPGYPDRHWAITVYEFWVGTCFIGVLPLVLATFAPLSATSATAPDRRLRRMILAFLSVTLAFGLALALGKYTPLSMLLFEHVPGFDRFRWPSKALQLVAFALTLLAGFGLQGLLERRGQGTRQHAAIWLTRAWTAIAVLMLVGLCRAQARPGFVRWISGGRFLYEPTRLAEIMTDWIWAVVFAGLAVALVWGLLRGWLNPNMAGGLAVLLAFANLFIVSRQIHYRAGNAIYERVPPTLANRPVADEPERVHSAYALLNQWFYGSRDPELFMWHKAAIVKESSLPLHVFKNSSGSVLALALTLKSHDLLLRLPPPQAERLADIMAIRHVVAGPPAQDVLWGQAPREVHWQPRPSALPRAYLVSRWETRPDADSGFALMLADDFEPRSMAVVEPSSPAPSPAVAKSALPPGHVTRIHYDWNRTDVDVDLASPGLLVLADTFYPGWRCTVDGEPAVIQRANVLFRGVFLTAGQHRVAFVYDPPQFRIGLLVSAATLGLIALLMLAVHGPRIFALPKRLLLRAAPDSPDDVRAIMNAHRSGANPTLHNGKSGHGRGNAMTDNSPRATPHVSVLLAAYNEAGNITPLAQRLQQVFGELQLPAEIIFVVEGADGSKEEVEALQAGMPNIRLLYSAQRLGIAAAFRRAFVAAHEASTLILTMDADLNHQPEELPDLLRAMTERDADIVVGSRYIPGGVIHGMPRWKVAASRFMNHVISHAFGIRIADKTSGYRLMRADLGRRIAAQTTSLGFDFFVEFIARAERADARIVEVPITFTWRVRGISKMRKLATMRDYVRLLCRLRRDLPSAVRTNQ